MYAFCRTWVLVQFLVWEQCFRIAVWFVANEAFHHALLFFFLLMDSHLKCLTASSVSSSVLDLSCWPWLFLFCYQWNLLSWAGNNQSAINKSEHSCLLNRYHKYSCHSAMKKPLIKWSVNAWRKPLSGLWTSLFTLDSILGRNLHLGLRGPSITDIPKKRLPSPQVLFRQCVLFRSYFSDTSCPYII